MARMVRVGRAAAWLTVLAIASATTLGMLGLAAVAPDTAFNALAAHPTVSLLAAIAALLPWWAILAVAAQRRPRAA